MEEFIIHESNMGVFAKMRKEMCEEDYKKDKPPFGTAPYWFMLSKRIAGLSEAISRNAGTGCSMDTKIVREWAQEIICHCNSMDEMRKVETEKSASVPGFKGGKIPKC